MLLKNKCTISTCLSNVCSNLQCPAVLGNYWAFKKNKKTPNETLYLYLFLKIYILSSNSWCWAPQAEKRSLFMGFVDSKKNTEYYRLIL